MGLFDRIFRRPTPLPFGALQDGTPSPLGARLLELIQLAIPRQPFAPELRARRVSRGLMTEPGGVGIMIDFLEVDEQKVHAHIVASLANFKSPRDVHLLDACIMGRGQGDAALEQAAEIWIRGVAAPLFSLLTGREQLGSSHFTGAEPWGVPNRHGWIGATTNRGTRPFDEAEEGALPLFVGYDYPEDELLHLVKVTLLGMKGKWRRYLEIDGHARAHVDEDWQCGIAPPEDAFALNSFAIFFSER